MGGFGERCGGTAAGFPVLGQTSILWQPFFLRRASPSWGKTVTPPYGKPLTPPSGILLANSSGILLALSTGTLLAPP